MATEPFLPAEPALADLAEQFEQWRRTRATAQERIPQPLWDQTVVLTTILPCSQVAKRLRLNPRSKEAVPGTAEVPGGRSHLAPSRLGGDDA